MTTVFDSKSVQKVIITSITAVIIKNHGSLAIYIDPFSIFGPLFVTFSEIHCKHLSIINIWNKYKIEFLFFIEIVII